VGQFNRTALNFGATAKSDYLSSTYHLSDLILDYSDNYQKLTDEKALSMLDDMLDIQKKRVDLRRKYVKKFKKVLTPKRVVMFYQLENKMDAVVMVQVTAEVPLVK
jgi:hypothetical protein